MWVLYYFSQTSQPVHHHAPPLILGDPRLAAKLHCFTVDSISIQMFQSIFAPISSAFSFTDCMTFWKRSKLATPSWMVGIWWRFTQQKSCFLRINMVILVMCGDHFSKPLRFRASRDHQIIPVQDFIASLENRLGTEQITYTLLGMGQKSQPRGLWILLVSGTRPFDSSPNPLSSQSLAVQFYWVPKWFWLRIRVRVDPQNLPVRVCNHPFWVVANTFSPLSHTQIYTLYIYVCIYTYKANVLLCRPLVTFVAAFYEFLTSATSIHIYIYT